MKRARSEWCPIRGRTEPDCTEGFPEDMPLILTSQYLRFAGSGDGGQARVAWWGRGGRRARTGTPEPSRTRDRANGGDPR